MDEVLRVSVGIGGIIAAFIALRARGCHLKAVGIRTGGILIGATSIVLLFG